MSNQGEVNGSQDFCFCGGQSSSCWLGSFTNGLHQHLGAQTLQCRSLVNYA